MTAIGRVTTVLLADGQVLENGGEPILFGVTHDYRPDADSTTPQSPGAVSFVQLAVHPGGRIVAEIQPGAAFSHQHVAAAVSGDGMGPPAVEGQMREYAAPESRVLDDAIPFPGGQDALPAEQVSRSAADADTVPPVESPATVGSPTGAFG